MKDNLFLVYPVSAESGTLETLPPTKGMKIINERQFLEHLVENPNPKKICVTSEATLDSILKTMDDKAKQNAILSMKDKLSFRKLLHEIYPQLNFQHIHFDKIKELDISEKQVLKPIKGCFGTAVKIVDKNSDLHKISDEIKKEIKTNASVLSESVLSQSEFIIEDFIPGDEYAVDMFYDSKGDPHIMNIYYHPLPKHKEYLHMIYYTNKTIFERIFQKAIAFFNILNEKLQLKNIALHSEFKYSDLLIPIEINAMRFGGMGLGNMVYHCLKINPYHQFIKEESPDWNRLWNEYPENNFVYFIAYNGTQIDKNTQKPNLNKLEKEFTKIVNKTIFDYKNQLAFGVYTLDESNYNIENLLKIDFNNYFESIN